MFDLRQFPNGLAGVILSSGATPTMTKTALILGSSGKIGKHAAAAFARAGYEVRRHDRKTGDLMRDARGATVIVNGWNPPAYHDWATLVPKMTEQVIAAARVSSATVIIPGNVYNMDAEGGEWSESTVHRPPTRKGAIREAMERAYEASGVQTIVLRAGNFIDPKGQDDVMSLLFLRALKKNKLTLPGDASASQAYCYVPDWARAAVGLAEKKESLEWFEDVPFPGHTFSARQLQSRLEQELGRPLKTTNFPWGLFVALAPFWELAREMVEMRYLFSLSHSLSGEKLAGLLPDFQVTPLEEVLRTSLRVASAR